MCKLRYFLFGLTALLLGGCNDLDFGDDPESRRLFLHSTLENSSWRFSFIRDEVYCDYYLFEPNDAVTEKYTRQDSCHTANYRWIISTDGIDMDDPDRLGILYLGAAKFYISDVRKDEFDMWRDLNGNLQELTLVRLTKLKSR
jgi:hypothetical protein